MNNQTQPVPRQLRWPRFALAGVVIFLLLSVLWVSREVDRIKRYKAGWSATTNAPAAPPAGRATN